MSMPLPDEFDTDADILADWRAEARCDEVTDENHWLANAWVGDHIPKDHRNEAKRICVEECPVRNICLKDALDDPQAEGVRGGYHFGVGRLSAADTRELMQLHGIKAREKKRSAG